MPAGRVRPSAMIKATTSQAAPAAAGSLSATGGGDRWMIGAEERGEEWSKAHMLRQICHMQCLYTNEAGQSRSQTQEPGRGIGEGCC